MGNAVDVLPVADAWTQHAPAPGQLLVVRDGPLLLAQREFVLRLPPGTVVACDAREPLRWRRASMLASTIVTVVPAPRAGESLDAAPLPMVYAPDDPAAARLREWALHSGQSSEEGVSALIAAQQAWLPRIERCTGRYFARKLEQYLRLSRARALLEFGDAREHDLQAVAEVARLSQNYFVTMFGAVFGESPHQYRVERRLLLARSLVAETHVPIQQILRQLGLDSHSTFTRMFRQRFGVSASRLRASVRANAAA